jgi:hypothetical protein
MPAIHSRRVFLAAGPATAVFASLSAAARAEAQSPLRELIEAHRRSHVAFEEICGPEGDADMNSPEYPAVRAEWERRNAAEEEAMDAVCAYPAKTLEEASCKAEYLLNHTERGELQDWQYRAVLGSFAA